MNPWRMVWLVAAIGLASCNDPQEGPLCLADCELCSDTTCPPDRCGVLVVLSGDCENQASEVEVAADQCLEETSLTPGSSMQLCATVPVNKSRVITARDDNWIWQRTVTCDQAKAGRIVILTLSCADQSTESGDVVEQDLR